MIDFRCRKCNKLLARYANCQYLEIKCTRCSTQNVIHQSDTSLRFAVSNNYFVPLRGSNPIPTGT
ncbi:MAG: Com family DNA-binding transcriptional regulator [Syntrophomonas sp.]